jgi:hypothetical protein
MKKKYQNSFFIFGAVVLAVMVSQLDFAQVWAGLKHAGYWFFAMFGLWVFLYALNNTTWYLIIRSGHEKEKEINWFWLYKITISGFALNYATPGGLMGGEPYKIMELSPKIGPERASSSVILFSMTHIFAHFLFWFSGVFLYIATMPLNLFMDILLAAIAAFCILGLWLFSVGYRKGMAVALFNILKHIPGVKKWARRFIDEHAEQLKEIDLEIGALHKQNKKTFYSAVAVEYIGRIASCLEIYFALRVLTGYVPFYQCILILAFTSLFANLLFFIPLQLGGREGGFLMSTAGMRMPASYGIFIGLLVRIRELLWTAIGLLFIKIDKKKQKNQNQ